MSVAVATKPNTVATAPAKLKPVKTVKSKVHPANVRAIREHLAQYDMNQMRFLNKVIGYSETDRGVTIVFSSKLMVYTYGRARYGNERAFRVEQYYRRPGKDGNKGEALGWWAVPGNRNVAKPGQPMTANVASIDGPSFVRIPTKGKKMRS